jgi:predicted porin
MKKSLIALAVLAASGASFAQSVTLYGLADVWFGSTKLETNGSSLTDTKLDSGGVNTSRWGMKGSEDLGGGLKANFQLEQGFDVSTGAAQDSAKAFNRQAWVGLSGGFGEVQLGKVWTSYDDIRSGANDTFGANIASSFSTWVGYSDRTNNGIKYTSPSFGPFSGSLTYALGEDKTATVAASRILSLGVQYSAGPVFVGYAHQEQKQSGVNGEFNALPGFITAALGTQLTTALFGALAIEGKTTYDLIDGSYDFGAAKVVGGYNRVKQTIVGLSGDATAKEFNLGVEVPVSPSLNIGLGYARSDIESGGQDISNTKGYSAAAVYSLSKRTAVYAAMTGTELEVSGTSDYLKAKLFAVGVNHKF